MALRDYYHEGWEAAFNDEGEEVPHDVASAGEWAEELWNQGYDDATEELEAEDFGPDEEI